MKKSVLVNYTGGFSGNFFTHLLAKSLGVEHVHNSNEFNAHFYNAKELEPKYIKTFGKLFNIRKGELAKKHLKIVKDNGLDTSYTYIEQLYDLLYEEDDEAFIENVKQHYADVMGTLKSDFFVSPIHYAFHYRNVFLSDVFPKASIVHFCTDSERHTRYFYLLFHYKNQSDRADDIFQETTLSEKSIQETIASPKKIKCLDVGAIPFNVGAAIFNKDLSELDKVEAALTKELNKPVSIDRKAWFDYADLNIKIIEEILGESFNDLSDAEQVKRAIKFIDERIRK